MDDETEYEIDAQVTGRLVLAKGIGYAAGVVLAFVAYQEWSYARDHPQRYGPANEIALASLAGLALAIAVVFLVTEVARVKVRIAKLTVPREVL